MATKQEVMAESLARVTGIEQPILVHTGNPITVEEWYKQQLEGKLRVREPDPNHGWCDWYYESWADWRTGVKYPQSKYVVDAPRRLSETTMAPSMAARNKWSL